VYVSRTDVPGLSRADSLAASIQSIDSGAAVLGRGLDLLSFDATRGMLWMASDSSGGIVSLDTASGEAYYYGLPSFQNTRRITGGIICQFQPCRSPSGSVTRLGDIAVAPNGDVYFSDMSYNRIGIVHPR
jgi:streptogramin lyase